MSTSSSYRRPLGEQLVIWLSYPVFLAILCVLAAIAIPGSELITKIYINLLGLIPWQWLQYLILTFVPVLAVIIGVLLAAIVLIWWERRTIALFQIRKGPNRMGLFGVFQPVADAVKVLLKEDILPAKVDWILFTLAPILIFVPGLVAYIIIPFNKDWVGADVRVGILLILAISSLCTLALIMAGWASNNKYSLMGGMRAVAQSISYEVAMIMSIIGVIILAGSLNLVDIVNNQNVWGFIKQPLGFIIFFTCALAEINRIPFDLPEAESELVAGFNTEYSGFKFALFFVADYVDSFLVSMLTAVLFFGGWRFPFDTLLNNWMVGDVGLGMFLNDHFGIFILLAKTFFFFSVIVWLRGTYPRLRTDQLMTFSWKVLLPLTFVNIFITAIYASWRFGMFS